MKKLLEIEETECGTIWINPDLISEIRPDENNGQRTRMLLGVGLEINDYIVLEPVSSLLSRIAELKS